MATLDAPVLHSVMSNLGGEGLRYSGSGEPEQPPVMMAKMVQSFVNNLEREDTDIREAGLTNHDWNEWNKFKESGIGSLSLFLEEQLGLKQSIEAKAWKELMRKLPGRTESKLPDVGERLEREWLDTFGSELVTEAEAWQIRAEVIAGMDDVQVLAAFYPGVELHERFFGAVASRVEMDKFDDVTWQKKMEVIWQRGRLHFGKMTSRGPRMGIIIPDAYGDKRNEEMYWITDQINNLYIQELLLDSPELCRFFMAEEIAEQQKGLMSKTRSEILKLAQSKNIKIDGETIVVADAFQKLALEFLFNLTESGKRVNIIRLYKDTETDEDLGLKEVDEGESEWVDGDRYLIGGVEKGKMEIIKVESRGEEQVVMEGDSVVVVKGEEDHCEDEFFLDDFLTIFVPSDLRTMIGQGRGDEVELVLRSISNFDGLIEAVNFHSRSASILYEVVESGRKPWLELVMLADYPGMRAAESN